MGSISQFAIQLSFVLLIGCGKVTEQKSFMDASSYRFDSIRDGWCATVPESFGKLHDRQITAQIDPPPGKEKPQKEQLALVQEILSHLPSVIKTVEQALASDQEDSGEDYKKHIKAPTIWIPDDQKRSTDWTFVVERDDHPDFGWHLEFQGTKLIKIWAGD